MSTEEQAEKFGLASQFTELRALAKKNGYTIPDGGEFADDGYSGIELDRPALTRLREAVKTGAFQVVLVHDPDRLSRKLAHQLLLTEEFERAGVRLEFLTTPREDTPEGRLLLHVKAVIAEYEREKIRERTLRGKKQKARQGLIPVGPAPYGYRKDPDNPGRLVVHEEEARVVRTIFRHVVEEQRSIRKVAGELQRLAIRPPRGGHWAPSTVKRLLQSEVYVGRVWYNRLDFSKTKRRLRPEHEWIPIDVPPIVPQALFERAREQLRRNATVLSGRPSPRFYLLRGLLRCGRCGRSWHGVAYHGRRYYRCTSRQGFFYVDNCRSQSWKADTLEGIIWETVTEVLRNPGLLAEKIEAYRTRLWARDIEVRSDVEHLVRQLAEAERQQAKLLDLYLDEELQVPALKNRLRELRERQTHLQERLAQARARVADHAAQEAREGAVRRYCELALRGLEALTNEGRQQLLAALVDKIVVREDALEIHGVLPGRWAPPSDVGNRSEYPEPFQSALADRNRR